MINNKSIFCIVLYAVTGLFLMGTLLSGEGSGGNRSIPKPVVIKGKPIKVPLTVRDWVGLNHINSPVSSGIPLPFAEIKSVDRLRITTDGGREVPAQLSPLAWWPDKTVRWVLCDFQANVEANSETRYYLVSKPLGRVRSNLKVEKKRFYRSIDRQNKIQS